MIIFQIPFDTASDVIRAPSPWRLMILAGNEVYISSKAERGDQDYIDYYAKMQQKPG